MNNGEALPETSDMATEEFLVIKRSWKMPCKFRSGWWFGTWLLFSPIVGMMIQSDELIFFRGVG